MGFLRISILGLVALVAACSDSGSAGNVGGSGGNAGSGGGDTRGADVESYRDLGPWDAGVTTLAIALEAGLPIPENLQRLGTDGCGEDDVIDEGWPIIRHFVTAQLRWAFGFDEEPLGMSQEVESLLPEATFDYDEAL